MSEARILIVEDEGIEALDLQHRLASLGYPDPEISLSGEEAIQKVAEIRPALVLMDIMLHGGMDGVTTAEKIRSLFDIPVVYVTAYADEATLQRAKITEPYGYIVKPYKERELHITIDVALYKHKTERKLRESERWLATTLRSIGDGVITTDKNGSITFMNPVAEGLMGWKAEELLKEKLTKVFRMVNRDTRRPVENPVERVLAEGITVGLANHTILISREGTEIPIDDSAAPIKDDKGNVTGVVLVFRDVTEREKALDEILRHRDALEIAVKERTAELTRRKQAEEELRQAKEWADAANRAKSEFLARMSHEIRTPMNGVLGMTQLALMEPVSNKAREYLVLAQGSAKSLLEIIDDILDLSKIEAGRVELHNEEFDLRRSIEGALGTLAVLAREKGLRFDVEIAPELPERVRGDRGHLGQVLVNIVGNAIKFTENGAVSVKTSPAGPRREGNACVLVEVADTGAGIDPARLPKIFESFEQESASVHARYGGTGLGLTIAKRLVELMGGRIWAESRPGEGSTFRFTVELEQAEPGKTFAAAEKPAARLANGGCLRVLLAEDNPVNQLLGKALLEREGHTVVVAEDGRKAVEALARERFGIVLMDVRMPELNGDEIARMVREGLIPGCPRDIPIIALTAHALVGDRERFLAAGMDGYLAKPIDVEEFRRALLAAMEKGPGGSIR